jgi:hypothetical protein
VVQLFGVNNKFGPFQEADVPYNVCNKGCSRCSARFITSRRRHKKALKVFSDLFKVTKINALAEAVLLSYFRE